MSPSGAITAITNVENVNQSSAPAPVPLGGTDTSALDALSSMAGVTVRLRASLPANLGQNMDVAG
jgi:hypothetical protein